jgi:lysyl-tRNA synthetase class II
MGREIYVVYDGTDDNIREIVKQISGNNQIACFRDEIDFHAKCENQKYAEMLNEIDKINKYAIAVAYQIKRCVEDIENRITKQ